LNHRPRKRFGQNFLHDPHVIGRIVAYVNPQRGDHIVEIGPGMGAITLPLLKACGHLDVIELDRDLVTQLNERCRGLGELTVYNEDALRVDYCRLAGKGKIRLVGNLPYNISTPLLFHLLAHSSCIEDMHLMLQKEVVERMVATAGSGSYGRLSVMLQYRCRATRLFTVGPGAFQPVPRVESAVVWLVPHAKPPVKVDDERMFARIVKSAFGQRRKTLRNSLHGIVGENDLRALEIDPGTRAERLGLEQFALIANRASSAAHAGAAP
jgi:16S rRNA (adenine1518-N6/adenine1519-N6)-dimethyltransferase